MISEFLLSMGKVIDKVSLYLLMNRHVYASPKLPPTSQHLPHARAIGGVPTMLLRCYTDRRGGVVSSLK